MSELPLALLQGPQTPRRGRPRGATNKRSADLARWVAARYDGMTPGQQAAELAMITAAELRAVKAEAKALGVVPMVLAMGRRARVLAAELRCDTRDAMALLVKAQSELMPYVHQRLPQAPDAPGAGRKSLVIGMPDAYAQPPPATDLQQLPVGGQALDDAGLFDGVPEQVSPPRSHGDG